MKKLLIIALILSCEIAKPQAVVEHVYSNQTIIYNLITPVWNLNTYGWVYAMKPSSAPINKVSIYNSNHSLIKTIQLQMPANVTSINFSNISDKLFKGHRKDA